MNVVRIVELVDESTSMITHRQFEDAVILGPAVLAPLGASFIDCVFEGSFDSMIIVVEEGSIKQGIIGLQQVLFHRCRLRNIALIGTSELAQAMGQDFLRDHDE